MGEYTYRKSDREYIKIGTCEAMYFLRWDDIDKVDSPGYSLRDPGLWFRLPFPDEDNLRPGDYGNFDRCVPLIPYTDTDTGTQIPFDLPDARPGTLQVRHESSGLLLNVACHHGSRLPEAGPDITPHWNGRTPTNWALYMVKNHEGEGLLPIVKCLHCGKTFRATWAGVLPHINDETLCDRLVNYAAFGTATAA
jgi:hypothetical protein